MQPYQERVVVEHQELCEKIDKLTQFVTSSDMFKSLDETDRTLLWHQLELMILYRNTLIKRINRFKD